MRQIERERVISVENHPADSRVSIIEDGTVQTLTSRMGTGGGNVPLVMSFRKTGHPRSADEGQGWERTEKADTLNVFDNSENRTPILIVEQNQRERERERVVGADMQNGLLTGNKSMTMLASHQDCHSVPCVIITKERYE